MANLAETGLILVVDDTITNLEIISYLLKNAGFETITAVNGDKALKTVQEKEPDLILLDLMMPGMNGFDTCKKLKENPETSDIPVIFMTAIADTESKVKGLNLGAVDYIIKPFQEEEVVARIRTHLQLRNLTKTLESRVLERTAELSRALKDLQESQIQLVQKEKMSALGNLVAGVAHEINNPMGFIAGNLQPAISYIHDLFHIIDLYQKHYPEPVSEIQEEIAAIDLEYVRADLPNLISSMKEGIQRIRNISTSLRTFSRGDTENKVSCNIHDGIDSTLMILRHRLKASPEYPEIQVIRNYGTLPPIECFIGQMNQVFMNLLANAIDALEESNSQRSLAEIKINPHKIWIHTTLHKDKKHIIISIKDNGIGIANEIQAKIFDHLFTTKPVDRGTGLGLSIARQIIVEKHGGNLEVNSVLGEGSEFVITMPINSQFLKVKK